MIAKIDNEDYKLGSNKMKTIVLYHRAASIHDNQSIEEKLDLLNNKVCGEHAAILKISERADNVLQQHKLGKLITDIRSNLINVDEILSYSLHTLVNCRYVNAMEQLLEILKLNVIVSFINMSSMEVNAMTMIYEVFQQHRIIERNEISRFRMQQNGTLVGRRPKIIDVDMAIKLREHKKSYKEIAEQLDCSISHVFRNMPKELRGCLSDKVRMRMRKLQERIDTPI